MENKLFTVNDSTDLLDKYPSRYRGKCLSLKDTYGYKAASFNVNDKAVHDANFAFLSTTLAKLHKELYEPVTYVTWKDDVPSEVGGGFVDYVEYFSVNWSGILSENRNLVSNNANYIPRVNASMNQERVNVFSYQVAYDLRFIELEKVKKLTLQKSIQDIYNNIIVAGWDLFIQDVAYTGINGGTGLFNSSKVLTTTITNTGTTDKGFKGLTDDAVVAFFNGIFTTYLENSNMNLNIIPDTFLVPTFVMEDLVSRFSTLYTNSLYDFILEHNIGISQSGKDRKITIIGRPGLNTLGAAGKGRIVAYKKEKRYVRIDIPYPMQHYMTMPNMDKMAYTSLFVGQVSEIQLPYNTSASELGIVTYWDFIA